MIRSAVPTLRRAPALVALLLAGAGTGSGTAKAGEPPSGPGWQLQDLAGRTLSIQPGEGTRAVVFVFIGTECPIANRVLPEVERLARELEPKGVRWVTVYPNFDETAEGVRKHRADAGLKIEAGLDPEQRLAGKLGATVTPEAVVLTPGGEPIYQGRINDQYGGLGQGKPAPTRHDMEEALRDFLATGKATGMKTKAVGCRIQSMP